MNWKKLLLIIGIIVVLIGIVGFTVSQSHKNVVAVQTGKAARMDLTAVVSGSGEVRPKTYVNIGANAYGKIVKLFVKEGDKVKAGQVLAQIENVQPASDVAAATAATKAAQTDADAAVAAYNTAVADEKRAESDLERTKLDYQRAEGLFKQQLIAKADYDTRKAAYDVAVSGLAQAKARIEQMKAQMDSAQVHIRQQKAALTRASDVLNKTTYTAPFDGVITNLPVREGENVVMGIQNAPGSTLMTLADMSVITAEVRIDETDIINVKLGQPAEVTIDALPKQVFKGHVTEVGDNAMVRSTGVATSQSTAASQEAKDFKVVVTLDTPPENLRPGLSTTAKIITATRPNALTIPIQALTVRTKAELESKPGKGTVQAAAPQPATPKGRENQDIQGVFVVRNKKAEFVPVQTGISGTTDIEVLGGLKDNDEIVTGSYRVLRTLRNGAGVKVDNTVAKKADEQS